MNGPRKNLTPLDMMMMNRASVQGGVMNFLGKQPEVTAPIRAQSHADSPPVELAYITDAEKDLLVKANIHGSMAGKPNPGPAGIASLDDFFNLPGGGVGGGSEEDKAPSAESYGIQSGQAVSEGGQVFNQQNDGSYQQASQSQQQAQEQAAQAAQAAQAQGASAESMQQIANNVLEKAAVDAVKTGDQSFFANNFFFPGLTSLQAGAQLFGTLGDAIFKNPKAEQLKTDNFLSILKNQVLTTDAERKRYYEDYKDEINKAGFGSLNAFTTALDEAEIPQGSEAQYRLDPASYFDREKFDELELPGMLEDQPEFLKGLGLKPLSSRFAETTGGKLKLAQSNIEQYKKFLPDGTANPNYNPEFLKQVFDARMELQNQGINPFTGNRQTTDATGQVVSDKPILPPTVPPLPGPRPGPVPDPRPGPIPTPTPFPGTGIIGAVTDPRFVGPSFPGVPNYFNQGIADPRFARFFQIADQFPTTAIG